MVRVYDNSYVSSQGEEVSKNASYDLLYHWINAKLFTSHKTFIEAVDIYIVFLNSLLFSISQASTHDSARDEENKDFFIISTTREHFYPKM